jgi:hypothetical protein
MSVFSHIFLSTAQDHVWIKENWLEKRCKQYFLLNISDLEDNLWVFYKKVNFNPAD